jgi:hypothetical protein
MSYSMIQLLRRGKRNQYHLVSFLRKIKIYPRFMKEKVREIHWSHSSLKITKWLEKVTMTSIHNILQENTNN